VGIDELFVNVLDGEENHSLGVKLDLELFDEAGRSVLDSRQSGVKDAIIETTREQSYGDLTSISGKLYLKELLVSRINAFLRKPVVRSIHFSSFYLQ